MAKFCYKNKYLFEISSHDYDTSDTRRGDTCLIELMIKSIGQRSLSYFSKKLLSIIPRNIVRPIFINYLRSSAKSKKCASISSQIVNN